MNVRRLMYPAVAVIGIAGLGAYAFHAQRGQQGPTEKGGNPQTAAQAGAGNKAEDGKKGGGTQGAAGGPVAVDVARVSSIRLRDDVNATGTIRSNEAVIIRPEVAGRITQINFGDGQAVKKGQLLIAFDSTVNQAEVQQAKAELGIARANFDRNADLARQKFLSERARDESAANVAVLDAKLALAQAKLSKLEIRAPFSGVVGMRVVSIGDYVKDGADLVNLEDISSVKVDFRVPEKFADRVRTGQELEIVVDALPDKPFRARVDAVDPQVDSSGRSALLRGRIPNSEAKLKPGMFARVKLILAERDNALVVPEEAIVPQGNKAAVWKVVDGKAVRTEVRTGVRRDAKVEILNGLALGDTIVTAGQMRLSRDGAPVRIANGVQDNSQEVREGRQKDTTAKDAGGAVQPNVVAPRTAASETPVKS